MAACRTASSPGQPNGQGLIAAGWALLLELEPVRNKLQLRGIQLEQVWQKRGRNKLFRHKEKKNFFFPYKNNYTLPTTGGVSTTPISQNLGCGIFCLFFPLLETVLLQLHSWNLRSFLGKREPLCCKGKTNVFASESTVTLLAARAVCI